MHGILRLKDLGFEVGQYYEKLPVEKRVRRIVGVVFCLPTSKLTGRGNREVIEYFNFRSGSHVNFYFAGYAEGSRPGGPKTWEFCPHEFEKCRQEIEELTKKRYSGGTDLFLLNTRHDPNLKTAAIDFSTAEQFQIEQMLRTGAVADVGILFEEIFRYCEEHFHSQPGKSKEPGAGQIMKKLSVASIHIPSPDANRLEKYVNRLTAEVDRVKTVTEALKETLQPVVGMYKDPRMSKVREESIRQEVPDWIVDRIVSYYYKKSFPSKGDLQKDLGASGGLNKLNNAGKGSSLATIARWLGIVRKQMEKQGFIEKQRLGRVPVPRSMERYNPDSQMHQDAMDTPDEDPV